MAYFSHCIAQQLCADSTDASKVLCSRQTALHLQTGACFYKLHALKAARCCAPAERHTAAFACVAVSLMLQLSNWQAAANGQALANRQLLPVGNVCNFFDVQNNTACKRANRVAAVPLLGQCDPQQAEQQARFCLCLLCADCPTLQLDIPCKKPNTS